MATLIAVDGKRTEVQPKNGKSFTLEEAHALVGGYIERHEIPDGWLLMDEDGNMKGLPLNFKASKMMFNIPVVGPALVCKPSEFSSKRSHHERVGSMNQAKQFHIGDILSVTEGPLVSPTHIDGIYDILNFMTGDDLYTNQLPEAARTCRPYLVDQHPWATEAGKKLRIALKNSPYDESLGNEGNVKAWLKDLITEYGEMHEVTPIPEEILSGQ